MNAQVYKANNNQQSVIFTDYDTVLYYYDNNQVEEKTNEYFNRIEELIKENKITDFNYDSDNNNFNYLLNKNRYYINISENEKKNIENGIPSRKNRIILNFIVMTTEQEKLKAEQDRINEITKLENTRLLEQARKGFIENNRAKELYINELKDTINKNYIEDYAFLFIISFMISPFLFTCLILLDIKFLIILNIVIIENIIFLIYEYKKNKKTNAKIKELKKNDYLDETLDFEKQLEEIHQKSNNKIMDERKKIQELCARIDNSIKNIDKENIKKYKKDYLVLLKKIKNDLNKYENNKQKLVLNDELSILRKYRIQLEIMIDEINKIKEDYNSKKIFSDDINAKIEELNKDCKEKSTSKALKLK